MSAAQPSLTHIRRAVTIGARGFIGARLTAALADRGVEVACFTRGDELNSAVRTADVVYYLASTVTPALAEQHPDWGERDRKQLESLLRRLARTPTPPTVVLTGSSAVYDERVRPPYREDSPLRGAGRYGTAKLAMEAELAKYRDTVPGIVLRLCNVYGPGQSTHKSQGVLAHWLCAAAAGLPLRVLGEETSTRDYVYIDDVVEALLRVDRLIGRHDPGVPRVVNIGSGAPTSLSELKALVELVVGREVATEYLPGRALDRRDVWVDVARAAEVLDWRPGTSLAHGVGRTSHWTLGRQA
jgi:UDP-glucose 4-epimerase